MLSGLGALVRKLDGCAGNNELKQIITLLLKLAGIILCIGPANEGWLYIVISSLIGWTHTQNDPWASASYSNYSFKFEQIRFIDVESFNSLTPGDAYICYMHQWTDSSLDQTMARHLFCNKLGLTLDMLKMESWMHMGCTAKIFIEDIIHIFASISKNMRILLMGRHYRERWQAIWLSEPMLTYCQLDPNKHISTKFHLKFTSFRSR